METLIISSRMPHFRLIAKIRDVSATHIDTEAILDDAPVYAGLEIMAQTAALHVRRRLDFKRHAFLLSVPRCILPSIDSVGGRLRAKAVLQHQSSDAFSYHVEATGPVGENFTGDVLIGARAYDDRFQKANLSAHYRRVWDKLKGD